MKGVPPTIRTYLLELKIRGLKTVYCKRIASLEKVRDIIHEEYFNIFGNLCRIISSHVRIMEYPRKTIRFQKYSIFAEVKPLWREERASFTINRFLWNCCHPHGLPPLKKIQKTIPSKKKFKRCPSMRDQFLKLNEWYNEAFHHKIVHFFTKNKPQNQTTPRLVLIFGLPGSGKNWVLEKKREKGHVHINVDDCRALLPKYWKGMIFFKKHTTDQDWIQLMREECAYIAQKIFQFALKHRMNIVWNGTGKNYSKYDQFLATAQKNHYATELRYIWVPIELAKARVHRRASVIGRTVPDEVIALANKKIPEVFRKLTVNADHARIFANTEKSPTMIWDKQQGWMDCSPKKRKSITKSFHKVIT